MDTKIRTQDYINLVLGVWLFLSPFFGFGTVYSAAAINGYIFGALIVVISLVAIFTSYVWEEFLTLAISVWLIFAPLALGFWSQNTVMLNHVDVGVLLFGVTIWTLTMRPLHSFDGHLGHHAH